MAWNTCYKCKCQMWIPDDLNQSALHARGMIPFYCAYGHKQFYVEGESEEDKLRRERDRLAQQIAERNDRITALREERDAADRRAAAARGQVTKIKNRVGAGVCPCCTRSFNNLRRHMETEHAGYRAEAAE